MLIWSQGGGKNEIQIKQLDEDERKHFCTHIYFVGHDRMQESVARCFEVQL